MIIYRRVVCKFCFLITIWVSVNAFNVTKAMLADDFSPWKCVTYTAECQMFNTLSVWAGFKDLVTDTLLKAQNYSPTVFKGVNSNFKSLSLKHQKNPIYATSEDVKKEWFWKKGKTFLNF